MFLVSSKPLPDGTTEQEGFQWGDETALGLLETDYARTWVVYDSREEYVNSLD